MSSLPEPLHRLIGALKQLPGIGEKSATRIAFHLLAGERAPAETLGAAISSLHEQVARCEECGNFADGRSCHFCRDPARQATVLCVVEDPADISAVERARVFRGKYHVLMGVFSPVSGKSVDERRIERLLERIRAEAVEEVVIATNPNHDGEATAAWLAAQLKPEGVRVSRIGIGVPMGSELVHADETTMAEALTHRSAL